MGMYIGLMYDFINKRWLYIVGIITLIVLAVVSILKVFKRDKTPKRPVGVSAMTDLRKSIGHIHNGRSSTKPSVSITKPDLDYIATSSVIMHMNKEHLSDAFLTMMMITTDDKGAHTMIPIVPIVPSAEQCITTKVQQSRSNVRVVSHQMDSQPM